MLSRTNVYESKIVSQSLKWAGRGREGGRGDSGVVVKLLPCLPQALGPEVEPGFRHCDLKEIQCKVFSASKWRYDLNYRESDKNHQNNQISQSVS